jgi:excinuclease ABC subunit A
MCNRLLKYEEDTRVIILAPIAEERKGTFEKTIEILRKDGYSKAIIDGEMVDLDEDITLEKNNKHNILVVIDRIKIRPEIRSRLYESLETASRLSDGNLY